MYVLDLLNASKPNRPESDIVSFEYRLLCSGELYNSTVITTDWRKSEATRSLVRKPFSLTVCSHPFDDYPQELCLRFEATLVTETRGNSSSIFYPDEFIARDLAAILSLLLRRLITVSAKTREIHPRRYEEEPDFLIDLPVDFVNRTARVHWARKPSTVVYGREGIIDITDYNPPPLGVDPDRLSGLLIGFGSSNLAPALLRSARLYSEALQQLEHDVDLAYQSLVSCVETTANEALRDYHPTTGEMLDTKRSVLEMANKFGLDQEKAQALALEACSGMSWATKKFTKFLVEHTGEAIWHKDDLFHPLEMLLPKPAEFERTIRSVYRARAGATHEGHGYPGSVGVGIGPTIPNSVFLDLDLLSPVAQIPPVVWFERVVNSAIKHVIEAEVVSQSSAKTSAQQDNA